jgi:hypothetical protein
MDEEDDRLQCGCKWHVCYSLGCPYLSLIKPVDKYQAAIEFYIRDLGVLEGGQLAVSKDVVSRRPASLSTHLNFP